MIWFLTFLVGLSSVIQAGLNRQMAEPWGLPATVLLNAVMFLVAAAIYFFLASMELVPLPDYLTHKGPISSGSWWYLLPGVLGFLFVLGLPICIAKIGALQVFVGLVLAQIIGGLFWDKYIEGINWSWNRWMAGGFAVIAVILASLS